MSYTGQDNLDQLDVTQPEDTEEVEKSPAAQREVRRILKNVLLVAHNADGSLKPIGTVSLADESITSAKLADLSVTGEKLASGSVTTEKLAALVVTEAKLADLSLAERCFIDASIPERAFKPSSIPADALKEGVGESAITDDSITTSKIKDSAVTSAKINSLSVDKLTGGASAQLLIHDGSNWVAVSLSGDISINSSGVVSITITPKVATLGDLKTRGTPGGSHPGNWAERDLGEIEDPAGFITFTGNEFTVSEAGVYKVSFHTPGAGVGLHQARLYADQGSGVSSVLSWGTSAYAPLISGEKVQTTSVIEDIITITDPDWLLSVQHWVETPASSDDFGMAVSSDSSVPYANHREKYTFGFVERLGDA